MKQKIKIEAVIGANYGDEGKGLFTNYLCRHRPKPFVIMTNGGSQRGHTVELTNGLKHVFHHFSSGTLQGAITYFPKQYLLNPMQFVKEYDELTALGYKPFTLRDPNCVIQLPGDIALNWHIEKSRGEHKHGSVGCGIWETKYRIYDSTALTLEDFCSLEYSAKIKYIKDTALKYRKIRCSQENISEYADIFDLFLSKGFIDHYISDCEYMLRCCKSIAAIDLVDFLEDESTIIFENGQGLKLDQFYGAKNESNTTPSFTGSLGIAHILNYLIDQNQFSNEKIVFKDVNLNYVSRTYLTKHGAGEFIEQSTFGDDLWFKDETNIRNDWQDELRFANLDYEELLERCKKDVDMFRSFIDKSISNINMNIVMTHANEIDINDKYLNKIKFVSYDKYSVKTI